VLLIPIQKSCNDGYTAYVQLYDRTNGDVWPSATTGWMIKNGESFTTKISCTTGDTIAFGAANNGDNTLGYWGVGFGGRLGCTSCSYTCKGTSLTTISLTC
jgi:hypothetical protein